MCSPFRFQIFFYTNVPPVELVLLINWCTFLLGIISEESRRAWLFPHLLPDREPKERWAGTGVLSNQFPVRQRQSSFLAASHFCQAAWNMKRGLWYPCIVQSHCTRPLPLTNFMLLSPFFPKYRLTSLLRLNPNSKYHHIEIRVSTWIWRTQIFSPLPCLCLQVTVHMKRSLLRYQRTGGGFWLSILSTNRTRKTSGPDQWA